MRPIFFSLFLFLITLSPVFAQEADLLPLPANQQTVEKTKEKDSKVKTQTDTKEATISASPEASSSAKEDIEASPAASPQTSPSPEPLSQSALSQFFKSETNRAATLFTLAVVLILGGFMAGKKSSGYPTNNGSDE